VERFADGVLVMAFTNVFAHAKAVSDLPIAGLVNGFTFIRSKMGERYRGMMGPAKVKMGVPVAREIVPRQHQDLGVVLPMMDGNISCGTVVHMYIFATNCKSKN